jgi:hypothetical protein
MEARAGTRSAWPRARASLAELPFRIKSAGGPWAATLWPSLLRTAANPGKRIRRPGTPEHYVIVKAWVVSSWGPQAFPIETAFGPSPAATSPRERCRPVMGTGSFIRPMCKSSILRTSGEVTPRRSTNPSTADATGKWFDSRRPRRTARRSNGQLEPASSFRPWSVGWLWTRDNF